MEDIQIEESSLQENIKQTPSKTETNCLIIPSIEPQNTNNSQTLNLKNELLDLINNSNSKEEILNKLSNYLKTNNIHTTSENQIEDPINKKIDDLKIACTENMKNENNTLLGKKHEIEKNEKEDQKKNYSTTYNLNKLNRLTKRFGYCTVLKCLYKTELNEKRPLEKHLKLLIESEGLQKILIMLLHIHCNNNKENNCTTNNKNEIISEESNTKSNSKKKIKLKIEEPITAEKDFVDLNQSFNKKSGNVGNGRFRKELGLGIHLHKDKMNNIYKYTLHHFSGNDKAVFYCSDRDCKSNAVYDVDTKKFVLNSDHTKAHEEHNYISNMNKDKEKNIFADFEKKDKKEAQIIRKDGQKMVYWYN